jgi:hypothetical protein
LVDVQIPRFSSESLKRFLPLRPWVGGENVTLADLNEHPKLGSGWGLLSVQVWVLAAAKMPVS